MRRRNRISKVDQKRWPPEKIKQLKTLSKKHTRREVSEKIGIDYQYVCKKGKELGLKFVETEHVRYMLSQKKLNPFSDCYSESVHSPAKGQETFLFEDISKSQCKFPFGNTPPFQFCGQPIPDHKKSSYCPEHHKICHIEGSAGQYNEFIPN